MRLGCLGCLTLLIFLAASLAGGAVVLYFGGVVFEIPDSPRIDHTPADGDRAQQKLFELVLRDFGGSPRREPVVLTAQELNAFLARHLMEQERIPVSPLLVRLTPDRVEIQGKTTLRHLFKSFPMSYLPGYLPATMMNRSVWVTLRGGVSVEQERGGRKYGRFHATGFSLGNQELGSWLLSLMLGPGGGNLLSWPLPGAVDRITIQDGKVTITTRK